MPTFLSPSQHDLLAKAIHKEINIPFINHEREYDICLKIARLIDVAVESQIPDELLDGLNVADIQIEDMVADALKENLVPLIADLLSFPFLPTVIKRRILNFVVELFIDVMARQTTLDEAIEDFLRMA